MMVRHSLRHRRMLRCLFFSSFRSRYLHLLVSAVLMNIYIFKHLHIGNVFGHISLAMCNGNICFTAQLKVAVY